MSDKGECCLTFVLKWSFIIILCTTVFLLGFSFIYYSEISLDSKISSFFSFISTFGIAATIVVYLLQKFHSDRNEKKIVNAYLNAMHEEISGLNKNKENISKIKEIIKNGNIDKLYIRHKEDFYTFFFKIKGIKKPKKIIIKWSDTVKYRIYDLRQNSINVDIGLYLSSKELINSVDNFHRRINHVFSKYNKNAPKKNVIDRDKTKDMMKCLLFTKNKDYLNDINIKSSLPLH